MLMAQKLFWCLIVSLTAQVVVLAQAVSPAKQVETEALVEKAMEHGYVDGDIGSASSLLIQAVRLSPDDGELYATLAKSLLTLGQVAGGHQAANKALALAPNFGGSHFAKTQAFLLDGDISLARKTVEDALAREDIQFGPGDRGGLSLTLVGILMRAGDFAAAEKFLLEQRPALAGLADQVLPETVEEIGGGWHAIVTLAHIYRERGLSDKADALLNRFRPYNEEWVRAQNNGEIDAISSWNLAATGAGRIPDLEVLDYLEAAINGGFLFSWRYNFQQHPTLWPLRDHPDFKALIKRLAMEMAVQNVRFAESMQQSPEK